MRTIASSILILLVMNASAQSNEHLNNPSPQQLMPVSLPSKPVYFIEYCPGLQRNMDWHKIPPMPIPGNFTLNRDALQRMPYTNVRDMASLFPGIYQQRRGSELNVFAARSDGNRYIVDGMWCY